MTSQASPPPWFPSNASPDRLRKNPVHSRRKPLPQKTMLACTKPLTPTPLHQPRWALRSRPRPGTLVRRPDDSPNSILRLCPPSSDPCPRVLIRRTPNHRITETSASTFSFQSAASLRSPLSDPCPHSPFFHSAFSIRKPPPLASALSTLHAHSKPGLTPVDAKPCSTNSRPAAPFCRPAEWGAETLALWILILTPSNCATSPLTSALNRQPERCGKNHSGEPFSVNWSTGPSSPPTSVHLLLSRHRGVAADFDNCEADKFLRANTTCKAS